MSTTSVPPLARLENSIWPPMRVAKAGRHQVRHTDGCTRDEGRLAGALETYAAEIATLMRGFLEELAQTQ